MKPPYIDISDPLSGRVSSLCTIDADHMVVLGILPHGSYITPASIQDAEKLLQWMKNWIEARTNDALQSVK
jgi:hypothetical protein